MTNSIKELTNIQTGNPIVITQTELITTYEEQGCNYNVLAFPIPGGSFTACCEYSFRGLGQGVIEIGEGDGFPCISDALDGLKHTLDTVPHLRIRWNVPQDLYI